MQPIPLVRATSALPLFEFLVQGGAELRALRERAEPAFRQPGALLPLAYAGALFEDARRASGTPDLALRLGRTLEVDRFGAWGALIARAPTVGAFLQSALASYRSFNTGYRLWIVTRGDDAWVCLRYCRSLRRGRAQVIEFSLLAWIAVLRRMLGPSWAPTEVHLEGARPGHAGEIESFVGARILDGRPALAIAFPRRALAHALAGPRLAVSPDLPELPGPAPASEFAASVRQTVASLLPLGEADLPTAAEAAGTSVRSFQRRLGEVGLTFSEVVEEARFAIARRMLVDPATKVVDVSAVLGYSDSANFTRAFRRWSGLPPHVFRRSVGEPLTTQRAPRLLPSGLACGRAGLLEDPAA